MLIFTPRLSNQQDDITLSYEIDQTDEDDNSAIDMAGTAREGHFDDYVEKQFSHEICQSHRCTDFKTVFLLA